MKLKPSQIRQDGGTQPRAEIWQDVVDDYAEAMQGGATFPPIIVFYDGKTYWLADGFHRLAAWLIAFPSKAIECDVRPGEKADAQWFSYSANQSHGLRRTNPDKERAVKAALRHEQGHKKANELIAKHVGVDSKTVAKYRRELETALEIPELEERIGSDGKTYSTANIGTRQAAEDELEEDELEEDELQEDSGMQENAADGEQSHPTIKRIGNGTIRAAEAINVLMRIPKTDALREQGLEDVIRWCKQQLGKRGRIPTLPIDAFAAAANLSLKYDREYLIELANQLLQMLETPPGQVDAA